MPDLSDDARNAMRYWGIIEEAANERMTTADMWSLIHDAAEEMGFASPGVTLRGVAELRGVAGRIQESGRQFERLGGEFTLGASHIGEAPWHRPQQQQNALGIHQVRFEHTFMTPDGPQTEWRTSVFTGGLPGTKDELLAAIETDAETMAEKYGVSHGGIGAIQILAV